MKLDKETILYISALDSVSGVMARDCLVDGNTVSFLVKASEVAKAIGNRGKKVAELSRKLKKKIEILGYYENPGEFIKNAYANLEIGNVEEKTRRNSKILKVRTNRYGKAIMLKDRKRFERIKEFAKRNYGVDGIIVVVGE
jgi:NusA-like KH domain protein